MNPSYLTISLYIATLIFLLLTLLPLWRQSHWLVRSLDFPRVQLACIGVLLLGAQLLWLDAARPLTWLCGLALAAGVGWHLYRILPFTPLWRKEVKQAETEDEKRCLRIITANVLTSNRNAKALLDLVHAYKPHILVTLESDAWWQSQLDQLLPSMPHSIKCPLDNLYGMHVYSRLPLHEAEIEYLVQQDVPSMHALVRLECGASVRVHFLHPAPPSPTENPESDERDAELVIVGRSVADCSMPVVVTGDLNDVAWSPTTRLFRKISGLLDPRVGRGMYNTFHAKIPFLRWPLDHLFHSEHFQVRHIERLAAIGSDHFPLFAELCFRPGETWDQEGPDAGPEDRQWAQDIVDEEGVSKHEVPEPEQS